jgi:predicted RNase H-like HicB family nuclease
MRQILRKYELCRNGMPACHSVVDGKTEEELTEEEKELCQFMVGGMQAK